MWKQRYDVVMFGRGQYIKRLR